MAKYIDADALKNNLISNGAICDFGQYLIDIQPAADVRPERHGRWVFREIATDDGTCYNWWLYGSSEDEPTQIRRVGRPPRLASGGIATGSTLAMVGDNPDVRVNPEVIAPLSDLSDMIFTGFSRALDRYAESRWEERSAPARQPLTVIVQLADGTELTRAIIDNINEIARQDGKSPLKGI